MKQEITKIKHQVKQQPVTHRGKQTPKPLPRRDKVNQDRKDRQLELQVKETLKGTAHRVKINQALKDLRQSFQVKQIIKTLEGLGIIVVLSGAITVAIMDLLVKQIRIKKHRQKKWQQPRP